ncbi:hypothetical protein C6P52_10205 [Enterococcus mundtii]|uniref:hypothetical protein n=1 Tax=Enterococcus mundtii TaxID=53346 RepID=UPI000D38098D|nr:hypothetical protein [Enterococcus mundtii]PTO38183.1 hypothetical protein C6P52_10205 [Enterococcus mundtii]PTO44236.1 hypothetical protein C6P54_05945 [Enterococcus mundtii]
MSMEDMPLEDISQERKLREDKLKEKNQSNINESFLSIFSYKNEAIINKIIGSPIDEKIRNESKDINFDTTHKELISEKKENIVKELKILDYQLEIIRLKRDIATIKGLGTISPSEQLAIDNEYARKHKDLNKVQATLEGHQKELNQYGNGQSVLKVNEKDRQVDTAIFLSLIKKDEFKKELTAHRIGLVVEEDEVNKLRAEIGKIKISKKTVLEQKVQLAEEKVKKIEIVQKELKDKIEKVPVKTEQSEPLRRSNSFSEFTAKNNDSEEVLKSKLQAISAIKEGYQNEIAETKGLIAYTEKVETEVVHSVEVKAEQAKEAVVLNQADREATVTTPTIEREPAPVIAEEPKSDQVDRAAVEKNPPPIDVNVIVNEASEKTKLQKPIVEEPKKEPVVSENLESKKAELIKAYVENLQAKVGLIEAKNKNTDVLLKRIKQTNTTEDVQFLKELKAVLADPEKLQKMTKDLSAESIKQMDKDIKGLQEETRGIKEQTKKLSELDHSKLKQSFFRNSRKIRAARWLLNLWPIAMIPLGMSWVGSILPSTAMAIFGQQFVNAAIGFVAASFFGSKAIIYAKKKIPQVFNKLVQKFPRVFGPIARGLAKAREKMPFRKQKQPAEQMKEATPVNEKLTEGIEKSEVTKEGLTSKDLKGKDKVVAMEAPTKEGANTAEIEEKQSRAKRAWETVRHAPKRMFDYVMKNKLSLFIMLAVPLALGIGGMFALSALVPMLATSMAAPFLMQLGAVALIGVGIGIGIQLLDKFVFKRIESRVAKREDLAFENKVKEKVLEGQELGKCQSLDSKEFREKVSAIAGLDEKAKAPEQVLTNEQQKTTERSERTSETAKESKVIEMKPRESTQPQPSTSQTKVEPTPAVTKEPVALTSRGNPTIERRASFSGTSQDIGRQASFESLRRNSLQLSNERNNRARSQQTQAQIQNNKKNKTTQL